MLAFVLVLAGCGDNLKPETPIYSPPDAPPDAALSSAAEITAFELEAANNAALASDVKATISGTSISAIVPFGTDASSLIATFTTTGTSVKVAGVGQTSGVTANNFTAPLAYTVSAEDGSTRVYTVTVAVAPSDAKAITAFSFAAADNSARLSFDVTASITGTQISAILPFGTDTTSLIPTFTTTGASVSVYGVAQQSGVTANDFTSPVSYTVTAADGSTQVYSVTVNNSLSGDKDILQFSLLGVDGIINGTEITLTVPFGSNVTHLVPTITISGVFVSPESGVANDFTGPVTYVVRAADNTTKSYTVKVTIAGNSDKDITRFTINGLDAVIASTSATTGTIEINMPNGSTLTNLCPVVTITGVSVSPASGVPVDFSQPVDYVVTAADGSTKTYTVTVGIVNGYGTKLITSFTILGISGQITNGAQSSAITLVLPTGTNLDGQTPTIVINASSISPPSRIPRDFTSPVQYTVTAADSSTRLYTVTVTTQ